MFASMVPKKKSPKKHKREGKFTLRYESCPKCNAAVGENNHNNRIAVYYNEETGEEDRRGHSGKCKKKVLNIIIISCVYIYFLQAMPFEQSL